MDQGERSRRGLCRYQRIKVMNEQKHAWRVIKYQFSCDEEFRIPVHWVRRGRANLNFFSMKLAGRATEKLLQFHRPFRGKGAFRMSAYRPKNLLAEDAPGEYG